MAAPTTIFPDKYSVTGIRLEDDPLVIITGSTPNLTQPNPDYTLGLIYRGSDIPDTSACSWNPTNRMGCLSRLPKVNGATPVTAVFYGPDTPRFTPSIGMNNVRVVGSYRESTGYDHGVKYQGPLNEIALDDPNNWKQIDMQPFLPNQTIANTILHSTMGNLIVGNYDLVEGGVATDKFNAFIYNIDEDQRLDLKRLLGLPTLKFITAYGIWQNNTEKNTNSNIYTIAGGVLDESSPSKINVGFLVDFYSDTLETRHYKEFPFQNESAHLTHFEGITKYGTAMTLYGPRTYSLAATGDKNVMNRGAAFATVDRNDDETFAEAVWLPVQQSTGAITTGNTVLQKNLYGIYSTGTSKYDFRSYVEEI